MEEYRRFAEKLVRQLSGDYGANRMDVVESLNRQLAGWATFYQYTDFTATTFSKMDRTVFWRFGHWLARKHRQGFPSLMRDHVYEPEPGQAKTWVVEDRNSHGWYGAVALRRLVTSRKGTIQMAAPVGKSVHGEGRGAANH